MNPSLAFVLSVFVCGAGLIVPSDAMALEPVVVNRDSSEIPLGRYLEYFEDEGRALTFEDVLMPSMREKWIKPEVETPNFGFNESAFWFRFNLEAETRLSGSWLIQCSYMLLDYIDVYIRDERGQITKFEMGDVFLFEDRPVLHRHFLIPFDFSTSQRLEFFLRVQSKGTVQLPLSLWRANSFWEHDQTNLSAYSFFFGVMFVMALYNLFIFVTLREVTYLYYVGFVVFMSLIWAALDGLSYQYLWPNYPRFAESALAIYFPLAGTSIALFASSFLNLPKFAPRLSRLCDVVAIMLALIALSSALVPYRYVIFSAVGLSIPVMVICFVAGILRWSQGSIEARYYTVAWSSFLISGIVLSLNKFGVVPRTEFVELAPQFGQAFEVVVLSLALSRKLKTLTDENLRIQREAAENLKAEVDLQTVELREQTTAAMQAKVEANALREEAEAHAEELEILDQQKTAFFQNMSHELRTPLTLILNPLENQSREQPENTELNVATKNSRRLLRLVNQLLDFQKLEAGKKELELAPLDIHRFTHVCGDYFHSACSTKGVAFKVERDGAPFQEDGLPMHVMGEVDALEKVAFNYLSNALKYTPKEGSIALGLEARDNKARLYVKDTGPGISAEGQEKLFQVFSQVDETTTRAYEGTGLGLALVKSLVEEMHGEVGVESTPGQGSMFWAEFPLCDAPEQSDELDFKVKDWLVADQGETGLEDTGVFKSLDLAAQGEGELVLVVDDLADMRELIAASLKKKNYRVAMAPNGKRGLEIARELQPSLIITDWMMPQMSGPELIEAAKKDAVLQSVPIVLLTAKSDEESKLIGTEIGADAFLGKPFNDQELGSLVRNLLSLKSREREVEALNHQLTEGVLKRYLPPDLVDQIIAGDAALDQEPQTLNATILFSDLQGFTALSGKLRARKLARVLNEYLEVMNDVIFAHGGTVDKFIGDAIMVIFGAPKPLVAPEQAEKSVACARAMQEAMVGLNQKWQEDGIPELKMRIGIHHGPSVVGTFGSEKRSDYTAIGPTVNLASRIESVCVPGQVFVSGELCDFLPEDAAEEVGEFDLKGIAGEVSLYRVV